METITTPTSSGHLPGRLGDPDMCLGTDPRADARLIAGMTPYGMHENAPVSVITPSSPLEDRLAMIAATEAAFQDFVATLYASLPEVQGVERSVETIDGVDGNASRSTSTGRRRPRVTCRRYSICTAEDPLAWPYPPATTT